MQESRPSSCFRLLFICSRACQVGPSFSPANHLSARSRLEHACSETMKSVLVTAALLPLALAAAAFEPRNNNGCHAVGTSPSPPSPIRIEVSPC